MRLNKFLLRYAPPGIFKQNDRKRSVFFRDFLGLALDYTQGGARKIKVIDLHDITRRYKNRNNNNTSIDFFS